MHLNAKLHNKNIAVDCAAKYHRCGFTFTVYYSRCQLRQLIFKIYF